MEQILTLKVDLEHPDDAKFAIDEAVKVYEADKLKWTAEEVSNANHLAMQIMTQLCLDGYSIQWGTEIVDKKNAFIAVWISPPDLDSIDGNTTGHCLIQRTLWDTWIAKCVCLCRATGREVPAFIVKKAGECW